MRYTSNASYVSSIQPNDQAPSRIQPASKAQSRYQPATGATAEPQKPNLNPPDLQSNLPQSNLQPAASSHPSATILQGLHDEADIDISAEEMHAFLQELEEETKLVVRKKRRLNANEKVKLRSAVANVDQESLHAAIVDSISSMLHISGIEERRSLWDHIKSSEWLRNVSDHFLSEYIRLHQECNKGADKYALFYLKWKNI